MRSIATCIVCLFLTAGVSFAQQTTATTTVAASDTAAKAAPVQPAPGSTATTPPTPASESPAATQSPTPVAVEKAPVVTAEPAAPVALKDTANNATTPKAAPAAASKTTTPTVLEESEEDLFLDGGEESIIAPAAVPVAQPKQAAATDSTNTLPVAAKADSTVTTDSAANGPTVAPLAYPVASTPIIPEKPATPARIEKTQSINFAKNFKEYRSPKVAILLSLLLPGVGQAYAHAGLKTAIFGAVEAGLITAGAIIAYKGGQKIQQAHRYADEHYDTLSFNDYYKIIKDHGFDSLVFTYDSASTFLRNARDKNQDYYTSIETQVSPFIQGWDDVAPKFDADFNLIDDEDGKYFTSTNPDSIYMVYRYDDTTKAMYGFSDNQATYREKLSDANKNYSWSQKMFALLVVNHIISAIDAGITAKAYNDRLLGKNSVWQRINIRNNYVKTPVETSQGYALEVRF